jgi:hypothetical protein
VGLHLVSVLISFPPRPQHTNFPLTFQGDNYPISYLNEYSVPERVFCAQEEMKKNIAQLNNNNLVIEH